MKSDIHPDYREVVFQDMSNNFKFISRSTAQSKEVVEFEGREYPLIKLEVTSESHPFYTGTQKILDSAGRVDKFRRKYAKLSQVTASLEKSGS